MKADSFNAPSAHTYHITTSTCPDTGRITAISDDIIGLVLEVDNIAEVIELSKELIPDLIDLNQINEGRDSITVSINNDQSFDVELAGGK